MSTTRTTSAGLAPAKALKYFRKLRHTGGIERGVVKQETLNKPSGKLLRNSAIVFVTAFFVILAFMMGTLQHHRHEEIIHLPSIATFLLLESKTTLQLDMGFISMLALALLTAFRWALFVVLLYWLMPVWSLAFNAAVYRGWPAKTCFTRYPASHQYVALLSLSILTVYYLDHGFFVALWYHFIAESVVNNNGFNTNEATFIRFIEAIILISICFFIFRVIISLLPDQTQSHSQHRKNATDGDFSIFLGKATGTLIEQRKHGAGIKPGSLVCLKEKDAAINTLILGGIGEGKTTSVIHTMLLQLLDQDCGGLIFDIKGNFNESVTQLADVTGKEVVVIGPKRQKINLLDGLSPESAAAMLSSIFIMTSSSSEKASFWISQASALSSGTLGILSFVPEYYTLEHYRKYALNINNYREDIDAKVNALELSDNQLALLQSYRENLDMFEAQRDELKQDIKSTIIAAFGQFTHPDIIDSFCAVGEDELKLEHTLDGKIFLLDIPRAIYGQAPRIVQTMIKVRWFNIMDMRRVNKSLNQDRPVFFLCDEFQGAVTADETHACISDLTFWDKARDVKAIGIVSAQSITSFYSAINKQTTADAILQNFRQKLCFKTEDRRTIQYLQDITGQVVIAQRSQS